MVEKRKFDVKLYWKSGRHEWSQRKKTVLAAGFCDAIEQVRKAEERPWRWDYHGVAKPYEETRAHW